MRKVNAEQNAATHANAKEECKGGFLSNKLASLRNKIAITNTVSIRTFIYFPLDFIVTYPEKPNSLIAFDSQFRVSD